MEVTHQSKPSATPSPCSFLLFLVVSAVQNQHDDLKKQYYELQDQHEAQGEDHNRQLGQHREHLVKLQQVKDGEISQLKGARLTQTHAQVHEVKEKKKKKSLSIQLSISGWSHVLCLHPLMWTENYTHGTMDKVLSELQLIWLVLLCDANEAAS